MASQIKCPTCSGSIIANDYKQKEETCEGFTGFTSFVARLPLISAAIGLFTPIRSKASLFDKKCPTCNGTGVLENKADSTKNLQNAAKVAQEESAEILKLETSLGPMGGNRHILVVGDDMLEVGLGFNDSDSYKIIPEGQVAPTGGKIEGKATLPYYRKSAAVRGTNPLATPGGHYHIKCSNKFSVFTGAQGVEINTVGPLTIQGGITKIISPEVTIGNGVGPVHIEGDHVQIAGKSIAFSPDPSGHGQVAIQGTLHTAGNIVAGGGAHFDGELSFISATCPGRLERTRGGSDSNQVTGPAQWSATASANALRDYIRKIITSLADPGGILLSPRGIQNLQQDSISMLKKALPLELQPTGILVPGTIIPLVLTSILGTSTAGQFAGSTAVTGPLTITGGVMSAVVASPIPLYNFPHHHSLSDGVHNHDYFAPNIKRMRTSEEVRKAAKSKESMAPTPISEPMGKTFLKLGNSILSVLGIRITP